MVASCSSDLDKFEPTRTSSSDQDMSLSASLTAPSGTISALPATVSVLAGGVGSSKISWSTTGVAEAQVYVSTNSGPETLFAQSLASSGTTAPWIQANSIYTFKLYAGLSKATLLSSTTVTGVVATVTTPPPSTALAVGAGRISASPSNVAIKRGTLGSTKVSWSTNSVPKAVVYVKTNNSTSEVLFGRA